MKHLYTILALLLLAFSLPADAATIRQIQVIHQNGSFALGPPYYADARVLAASTAETVTVPTGASGSKATYVLFSPNSDCADFYVNYTTTAAVPAADITNGGSPEANPTLRYLGGTVSTFSVISANSCIITLSWYM